MRRLIVIIHTGHSCRALCLGLLLYSAGWLHAQSVPVYIQKAVGSTSPLAPSAVTALGLQNLMDYGPFAVAEVPAAAAATFAARATLLTLRGRVATEFDEIHVRDLVISGAEDLPPGLPPELVISDYPSGTGLYVVQFRGPAHPDWLASLRGAGARIVHALPVNSYLVAMPVPGRPALGQVRGSRHAVVFQPAYKLTAELRPAGAVPEVRAIVLIDMGQSWEALLATLKAQSLEPVDYSQLGPYLSAAVVLPSQTLRALAADPRVVGIEPAGLVRLSDERACQIVAGNHDAAQALGPQGYLTWFGTRCGGCIYDLSGYIVNVIDTGLDGGAGQPVHPDLVSRVNSWQGYFSGQETRTDSLPSHGELVAGIIAGYAGTGLTDSGDPNGSFFYGMGIAPTVRLRISRAFDDSENSNLASPSFLQAITTDAYNSGARIQNQSWNVHTDVTADTTYSLLSMKCDFLVRDAYGFGTGLRPMFISSAIGNLPDSSTDLCHNCVSAPGNAKNVVSIGASTERRDNASACSDASKPLDHVAFFSPRGTRDLSQRKPDFVAPGARIASLQTQSPSPNYKGLCSDSSAGLAITSPPSLDYGYGSGTSYSTPLASGLAAIFSKYYRSQLGGGVTDPSPAMIKAMMVVGAEDMNGGFDEQNQQSLGWPPNFIYGWGRLGMQRIFDGTPVSAYDEDHGSAPRTRFTASGQQLNFTYTVANPAQPIRAALVYTDAPGLAGGGLAYINALTMAVFQGSFAWCADNGKDANGYTIRSGGSCPFPDLDNNVHFVNVAPNSLTGQFTINVVASIISQKAVPTLDGSSPNQDFALYVYNANFVGVGVGTPLSLYTIAPCRVVDTRLAPGPQGGLALVATGSRTFPITGSCGVPADARAVFVNTTAVNASTAGVLRVSGYGYVPSSRAVSYNPSSPRAGTDTYGLTDSLLVYADQPSGTVDVIIDVTGYFK